MGTVKVKCSVFVLAVVNSIVTTDAAIAQYLSDYSRLVVLSTVGPSIFTALLLQAREKELWT